MSFTTLKLCYTVRGLHPAERAVLDYLAYRANKDTHHTWPSLTTIAMETGVSKSQVQLAIAFFLHHKILIPLGSAPSQADHAWGRSNKYQINVEILSAIYDAGNVFYVRDRGTKKAGLYPHKQQESTIPVAELLQ